MSGWQQYEPPAGDPPPASPKPPPREEFAPVRPSGNLPGAAVIGVLAAVMVPVAVVIIASNAETTEEPDESGWYECIEEHEARESLFTPTEWCEDWYEMPSDWVDDHEDDWLEKELGY